MASFSSTHELCLPDFTATPLQASEPAEVNRLLEAQDLKKRVVTGGAGLPFSFPPCTGELVLETTSLSSKTLSSRQPQAAPDSRSQIPECAPAPGVEIAPSHDNPTDVLLDDKDLFNNTAPVSGFVEGGAAALSALPRLSAVSSEGQGIIFIANRIA